MRIEITPEIMARAKGNANRELAQHKEIGKDTILEPFKAKLIGYVGEELFHIRYPEAQRVNDFDYDFILGGKRVEIKGSLVTCAPRDYFNNDICAANTKQQCDFYFFTQILKDFSVGFLVGFLSKDEFFKKARIRKKGEIDQRRGFAMRATSYSVENKDLLQIKKPSF